MTTRRLLALTTAVSALALAAPASAQPTDPYEYAQDAPEGAVVYQGEPVIQPLPVPPPVAMPPMTAPLPAPPVAVPPPPASGVREVHRDVIVARPAPGAPYAYAPAPHPMGYHPEPPFDRGTWLANCRERIRGVSREERGGVIGGLLGAAAGGVIGNRAWDSERLAGTLLGAGVGGLAGLAIGSAIGAAGDRKREDECAWYLDRYMAEGTAGTGTAIWDTQDTAMGMDTRRLLTSQSW